MDGLACPRHLYYAPIVTWAGVEAVAKWYKVQKLAAAQNETEPSASDKKGSCDRTRVVAEIMAGELGE